MAFTNTSLALASVVGLANINFLIVNGNFMYFTRENLREWVGTVHGMDMVSCVSSVDTEDLMRYVRMIEDRLNRYHHY